MTVAARRPSGAPSRPVLRWHGGKFRLADWIVGFFPAHDGYVEPFGGAASVLMRKPRVPMECYNDLDGDVVNLFRVLRDPCLSRDLRNVLKLTPFARAELDAAFVAFESDNPVERARKLVVRSYMGFGADAGSRLNKPSFRCKRSNGQSFDSSPAVEFSSYADMLPFFTERMQGVVVEQKPAIQVIEQFDSPATLVYADPPYIHSSRAQNKGNGISHGYRYELSNNDHEALAECLHKCRGMVVLSGYASDLYDKHLYRHWERFERHTTAESNKPRVEVLWINPNCSATLSRRQQLDLLAPTAKPELYWGLELQVVHTPQEKT